MMDKWNGIRNYLQDVKHHRRFEDRLPWVYQRTDTADTFLKWEYDDNKICVRAKDYEVVAVVKKAIEIYLEER